ncbi:MAG TPA: sodium:proton antiporter NhaD [Chitinophagaceae bacterium]|nr:sodium:proton antiporter NhaD [Chitinophagaceae bacterium]
MTTLLVIIFILGYLAIALEHPIRINKAASALITGVLCWTVYVVSAPDSNVVNAQLLERLGDISGILFFLLGAMTIVELIDAHDGFDIITQRIRTTDKRKLMWLVSFITFFLSAVLDNLTTAIVMVSLLRKLIKDKETRLLFCGMVVIAANSGGAWSPIGDVTTTMLWIGGQITTVSIIVHTILPSLVSVIVPILLMNMRLKGKLVPAESPVEGVKAVTNTAVQRNIVFTSGVLILLMVPVFKTVTHLPPFMGILLGLGIMWVITEFIHSEKDTSDKNMFSVQYALRKIDTSSILFFLGILASVAALEATGILHGLSEKLDTAIGDERLIVSIIGVLSSIVDNVPLVAATMGMYSLEQYPTDHFFWQFLAYCAGTGGSILIIGSAAGVAAMGIEKIEFFWYLKRIAWLALAGYLAGAAVFVLSH